MTVPINNILILSYFFPPCNKVGGRRWAKFGNYLSLNNYNVHVLSVNVPFKGNCPWEKDTLKYQSNIFRLPYIEHRPFYQVNKSPDSISGKIKYRLSWYGAKLIPKKSTQDISEKYEDVLQKKAEQLIHEFKIETVIVTGGPFHWCYSAMQLKNKFTELNFLLDLRDFWTGGEAYNKMTSAEKSTEDEKEFFCISMANFVFTPADRISDFLKNKYPLLSHKIKVLPHAFDNSEMPSIKAPNKNETDTFTFAYGGILYSNMESAITRLIELLHCLISKGKKVKVDLYTFDKTYSNLFFNAGLENVVHYHQTVSPEKLFSIFQSTDYLLQLRAGESHEQHFKSTKFYELIALRKPIIYFGPEGDISEFLEKNRLGYSANISLLELADKLVQNKLKKDIPDTTFEIEGYEYKNVTQELEKYL